MPKSIVLPAFFPNTVYSYTTLRDRLQFVSEDAFYDTIEFYFEGSIEEKEQVKIILQQLKFASIFLGAFYLKRTNMNLGDLNEEKRRKAINKTKSLVDEAVYYGSSKMMVVSGGVPELIEDQAVSFDLLVESLVEICSYAKKMSDKLCITLEFFNNMGEPYFLIGPTSIALKLAERVSEKCDNFELTFDLSHVIQLQEDQNKSFQMLSHYVNHIHLANCVTKYLESPLYGDKHPPFNIQEGDVNEKDLKTFLNKNNIGDNHYIGMEVITTNSHKENEVYYQTTEVFKKLRINKKNS